MPPSAVIDASVFVSAFLFPESVPGRVLTGARDGAFRAFASAILIEETRRSLRSAKLKSSYRFDDAAADSWCAGLPGFVTLAPEPLPAILPTCRDPDDDHVIAAAIASGAGWIVTGDKDLLDLYETSGIRIVTPRSFLDVLATVASGGPGRT